jgi:plasmid stabilization system protein ParE
LRPQRHRPAQKTTQLAETRAPGSESKTGLIYRSRRYLLLAKGRGRQRTQTEAGQTPRLAGDGRRLPRALTDLERIAEFLVVRSACRGNFKLVVHALDVLRQHPHIGRPAEAGFRELVIARGRSGYLALYRYDEAADRITVYAIRHQREAGYDPQKR